MRYKPLKERPIDFQINYQHKLARGLVFGGLGWMAGSVIMRDRDGAPGVSKSSGTLTNMDPATDWVWVSELGRWAMGFNGTDNYVDVPDAAFSLQQLTYAAWFSSNDVSARTEILGKANSSHTGVRIHLDINYLRAQAGDGTNDSWFGLAGGTTFLSNGVWYHAALTWDGTNAILYLDGKVEDTFNKTCAITYTNTDLTIGSNNDEPTGPRWVFNGLISDPCILSRPSTPSEISILADRSDPMLGGLILPPRRRLWAAVSVTARGRILGCGTGHILGA